MAPILAAVAQMTSTPSIAHNLSIVLGLIERASALGAKILFLPEAADFIAPASEVAKLSRGLRDPKNEFYWAIADATRRKDIWVNFCLHEAPEPNVPKLDTEGRCFNTNLLLHKGHLEGWYQKMKLFDVDLAPNGPTIKESNTTIPGDELHPPIPNTPVGNLGLQTCFDIRFSRPFHALLSDKRYPATAITYPSAFATHTGAAHWQTLLKARAIEGQCYIFGSAQAGEHYPGRRSYGHAMIVDPWGTVIAQCSQKDGPQICVAEVDLEYVAKVRKEMPMGWPEPEPEL
ncbi:Carbon-nitrogen hydrolase [Tulasnella sp. 330]|nr:Carbon-nitrogen hydrolase [Tulasnella sp. 330]KAG8875685.1 Carbon-nitrogen hydrolase [Tulasnella sp. 332]